VNKNLTKDQGLQLGPRFGFAWDVTGKQNIVVRTGGGIFYDRIQGNRGVIKGGAGRVGRVDPRMDQDPVAASGSTRPPSFRYAVIPVARKVWLQANLKFQATDNTNIVAVPHPAVTDRHSMRQGV
jgi:hypothetical protein